MLPGHRGSIRVWIFRPAKAKRTVTGRSPGDGIGGAGGDEFIEAWVVNRISRRRPAGGRCQSRRNGGKAGDQRRGGEVHGSKAGLDDSDRVMVKGRNNGSSTLRKNKNE